MSDEDDRALRGIERFHAAPSAPLTEEEMRTALQIARSLRHDGGPLPLLGRALLQVTADLAAETATRTELRTQASQVSGLLADAGVPVGDLVAGVAALVAERDRVVGECYGAVSRLLEADAGIMRERAERDEMRSARDMLLAEVDRLRARLADMTPEYLIMPEDNR